jgi:hypothetical protein
MGTLGWHFFIVQPYSLLLAKPSFPYVGAALLSTGYLLAWQTTRVSKARKAAKIGYPQRACTHHHRPHVFTHTSIQSMQRRLKLRATRLRWHSTVRSARTFFHCLELAYTQPFCAFRHQNTLEMMPVIIITFVLPSLPNDRHADRQT